MQNTSPIKTTVLVAASDAALGKMLEMVLSADGHSVVIVTDGKQALEVLRTRIPGILIADSDLPIVDGLDLCFRAKRVRRLQGMPVMILSEDNHEARRRAAGARADAFVLKPLAGKNFRHLVQTLILGGGSLIPDVNAPHAPLPLVR